MRIFRRQIALIAGVTVFACFVTACSSNTSKKEDTNNVKDTESAIEHTDRNEDESEDDMGVDLTDIFSERELAQTADTSEAANIELVSGQNVTITEEGTYVVTGSAENSSIIVDSADDTKIQLVLDGVNITNISTPAIYVKSADKVFVTTTESENTLSVTDTFTTDGDTKTDAVIFSKDDLVLNGVGTLNIKSTDNGISSKDDLRVTGGTLNIESTSDSIEANDSVKIGGGIITLKSQKDGIHCENKEDYKLGAVYIAGGTISIEAADDGIQGTSLIIEDGMIDIENTGNSFQYDALGMLGGGTVTVDGKEMTELPPSSSQTQAE